MIIILWYLRSKLLHSYRLTFIDVPRSVILNVNIFPRASPGEGPGGGSLVFPWGEVAVEWPVPAKGEDHQFSVQTFNLDLCGCCTLFGSASVWQMCWNWKFGCQQNLYVWGKCTCVFAELSDGSKVSRGDRHLVCHRHMLRSSPFPGVNSCVLIAFYFIDFILYHYTQVYNHIKYNIIKIQL